MTAQAKPAARHWLTTAEVAQAWGVYDSTVWVWVRRGRLTPRSVRGSFLFDAAEALRGLPPGFPPPVSPKAAATRLGVHRRTLMDWADAGRVGYVTTPGGYRRLLAADIDELAAVLPTAVSR